MQGLAKESKIDLFYADESGFCLTACVPYGWQKKGETVEIPCSGSKRMNVFGIYSTNNEFYPFATEGKINSDFVINALDIFSKDLATPTVVVIDNAPIHTSNKFLAKVEQWIDSNLYVFFLPKYSPHLNLIELLWRKIKYEWIDIKAFNSWEELKENVTAILNNIGTEFKIIFR